VGSRQGNWEAVSGVMKCDWRLSHDSEHELEDGSSGSS